MPLGRLRSGAAWVGLAAAGAALLISIAALVVGLTGRGGAPSGTSGGVSPTCPGTTVATKTMPSVVTLFVTSKAGKGSNGSGEFIDAAGHILTNNHVISSSVGGGTITVVRPNGEELPATLVGRDPQTDLAVVKVSPIAPASPVRFGGLPPIGAQVFAIGAPLGLTETFTSGVVSGLGRSVRVPSDHNTTALLVAAIQTDASINPGNSGGMLADCAGDMVGVPTAGSTASDSLGHPVAGSIGLGFAVPADTAQRVADGLIRDGQVRHGDFGVSVVPILGPASNLTPGGLYVTSVTPGGPTARASLQPGDIITALAGQPISGPDQLQESSLTNPPGTSVPVEFRRGNQTHTVNVVLA
jgi:putative serine protease PepD